MVSVPKPLEAVIFDKDGTLLDFHKTWDCAIEKAIRASALSESNLAMAAKRLGFDLDTGTTLEGSILIADSNDAILASVEGLVDTELLQALMFAGAEADVGPSSGLPSVLDELTVAGVRLAVATNDYVNVAMSQIDSLGWAHYFAAVVGCDSGLGAKPDPGMLLGCCDLIGADPSNSVMIGDSVHDVTAGNAAGLFTVFVTNGQPTVNKEANLVLTNLSGLAAHLGLSS